MDPGAKQEASRAEAGLCSRPGVGNARIACAFVRVFSTGSAQPYDLTDPNLAFQPTLTFDTAQDAAFYPLASFQPLDACGQTLTVNWYAGEFACVWLCCGRNREQTRLGGQRESLRQRYMNGAPGRGVVREQRTGQSSRHPLTARPGSAVAAERGGTGPGGLALGGPLTAPLCRRPGYTT